ncbi:MAG: hypothetical protein QN187_07705 [Armatimonadota bacterium]|nr:hypothetical protein [Armatimonadota bacterium]MDR7518863.1 hypothetical protein [Armatimonadota bacterium]MDR7549092.1 hypothetical protein [Armatimonadota bacterium]
MDRVSIGEAKRQVSRVVMEGLWSGTPPIEHGDLRRLRARIWSALASR